VRGQSAVIFILLLVLGAWTARAVATAATAPQVQLTPQDGGYLVVTPDYKARINPDGNLHSLVINGVEMLDDHVTGSAGASYFVEHPLALPTMNVEGHTLTATDGTYTAKYDFDEGFITISLRHTSPQSAAYVVFCSAANTFVENISDSTALPGMAAIPAEQDWSDVTVTTPTGEYLQLHNGTRIWDNGLGRQVWELSNMAMSKEYTLTLVPGAHDPHQPTLSQLTTMSAAFASPDHLVPAGKAAAVEVRFENNSNEAVASTMSLHAESSLKALLKDEQKPFACEPHKSVTLTWTLEPKEADFYTVTCSTNLGGMTKSLTTTFGYDTPAIKPLATKPINFTEYWNNVVAEAKAAEPRLTRLEDRERSTSKVTVYRIGMEAEGFTCFGWLAVPKFPGRYPGILFLPGEHVRYMSANNPNTPLAECGFVVLSIEPTGQSVEGPIKPLITQAYTHLNDPATFGLRAIMVRYLRAVTALAKITEVDPNRIAVSGIGMGGGMALALAALDERIWAVAADVPYHCYIELGDTLPDWPYREIHDYLQEHPDQREAVLKTIRYYDVANFADQVTCPVLLSAGIDDEYSRPMNIYGVYNRLTGPHNMKLYIADHRGGGKTHWDEKVKWLTQVLGGPTPQPAGAAAGGGEAHDGAPTP